MQKLDRMENVSGFSKRMATNAKFQALLKSFPIQTKSHNWPRQYSYPYWVVKHRAYPQYGQFIDYLMRHIISSKCGFTRTDFRATTVLSHFDCMQQVSITEDDQVVLKKAYERYVECGRTVDCIKEIFHTSLLHGIFFGRRDDLFIHKLSEKDVIIDPELLQAIDTYCTNKLTSVEADKIQCNPTLGCELLNLGGDGDLWVNGEFIDIKVSKMAFNQDHFIQLLIYYLCWWIRGHALPKFTSAEELKHYIEPNTKVDAISTLSIFNPLSGMQYSIDVSSWTCQKEFTELIRSQFSNPIPMVYLIKGDSSMKKELKDILSASNFDALSRYTEGMEMILECPIITRFTTDPKVMMDRLIALKLQLDSSLIPKNEKLQYLQRLNESIKKGKDVLDGLKGLDRMPTKPKETRPLEKVYANSETEVHNFLRDYDAYWIDFLKDDRLLLTGYKKQKTEPK